MERSRPKKEGEKGSRQTAILQVSLISDSNRCGAALTAIVIASCGDGK